MEKNTLLKKHPAGALPNLQNHPLGCQTHTARDISLLASAADCLALLALSCSFRLSLIKCPAHMFLPFPCENHAKKNQRPKVSSTTRTGLLQTGTGWCLKLFWLCVATTIGIDMWRRTGIHCGPHGGNHLRVHVQQTRRQE